MRRSIGMCVLMMTLLLSACGGAGESASLQEQALAIRSRYLAAAGCTAKLDVTADYGQRVYTYTVAVTAAQEETDLTVLAPQEVAGVTARLTAGGSRLEYDGAVVETGPLTADGLTPLSAIPALMEAARSGFIDNCTRELLGEQQTLRILCRDPALPAGQGQETTLWLDPDTGALLRGELSSDGQRVILCVFSEFVLT